MKFLFLACFVGLAVIPVYAAPADQASDKEAIKDFYARLRKAEMANDPKAIQSLMADPYTVDGKTYTKKESMAMMESVCKEIKKFNEYKYEVKSCEISGKTAKATTEYSESMVMIKEGKPHNLVTKGTNTETLVKTPQGWRLKTITTVKDVTTMDGKLVPGTSPGSNPQKKAAGKAHS